MAKKDIFDIFREKAGELEQTPSSQAWSRIERKMQRDRFSVKQGRVRQLPQPMSIAAGLALLIGLSVVFMWLAEPKQQQVLAQEIGVLEIEELALNVGTDDLAGVVETVQAHPVPKAAKPIVEGRSTQKLIVKSEANSNLPARSSSSLDSAGNVAEQRTGR